MTVTGVAASGFHGTRAIAADAWLPLTMMPQSASALADRSSGWLVIGARLKLGTSRARAASELASLAAALEREHAGENRGKTFSAVGWSPIPGGALVVAAFLALLMGIVTLVLVVACANVASMLLARAMARRHEIAVRVAIGAGRARLVRQLLTETLVLFGIGGAMGLVIAGIGIAGVASFLPRLPFPADVSLQIDWRVVAFAATVALAAALLTGLLPALQATRIDVTSMFKDGALGSRVRSRLRQSFVVAQVAASVIVGVLAGLFGRALLQSSVDPGFDPRGVELTTIDPARAGYTEDTLPVLVRELATRARALPGVQSATVTNAVPGGFETGSSSIRLPGVAPGGQPFVGAQWVVAEPDYFRTLGIQLIAGRDFADGDRRGAEPVAIVNESMARRFWPGVSPLGKVFEEGSPGRRWADVRQVRVIGVAADVKSSTLIDGAADLTVYAPLQQARRWMTPTLAIVTRASRAGTAGPSVRALVSSIDPKIPVISSQTLDDSVALGLMPQRVAAGLSSSLSVIGLLLAAIGIYGVMAYTVSRRTREIAIRVALGARHAHIAAMVLKSGLSLVAAGTIVGLVVAAGIGAALSGFLFGVSPFDLTVFGTVAALMALVSVVACGVPTRRALAIKAIEALRCD